MSQPTVKYRGRFSGVTKDVYKLLVYEGKKRVGGILLIQGLSPYSRKDINNSPCPDDVKALIARGADPKASMWTVDKAFLDEHLHNKGIGKEMYRRAFAAIAKKKGPIFVHPTYCTIGSGTSKAALRVWKSLRSEYISSGDVFFLSDAPTKRKNPSADVHIHRAEEQLARAKETKEPVRRAQRIGAAMQEAYWVMSDDGPHRKRAARIHREALKLRDAMTKRKNPAKVPDAGTGLIIRGDPGMRMMVLFDAGMLRDIDDWDDDRLYDGSLILGFLDMHDSTLVTPIGRGLPAYEVHSAAAKDGWGPPLYDFASMLAHDDDMQGIHPMVLENTKAVMTMWSKFPKARQKKESKSKIGFILKPPKKPVVSLKDIKSSSNVLIKQKAAELGWRAAELRTQIFDSGLRLFEDLYREQKRKER